MLYTDFCTEFNNSINKGDVNMAHFVLMQELGRSLVRNKKDFVDLLNESGYEAQITDSDTTLIDTFANNVSKSPSLMLGASMLVASQNKTVSFDGEDDEYLDDSLVKSGYRVIQSYFSNENENQSNAVGAIIGAVGAGAGLTKSIIDKKREKENYGANIASQKEASKQQIIQGVLQAKQQKAEIAKKSQEEKSKTRKIVYIVGGSVLAIAIIGIVIYSLKKRK